MTSGNQNEYDKNHKINFQISPVRAIDNIMIIRYAPKLTFIKKLFSKFFFLASSFVLILVGPFRKGTICLEPNSQTGRNTSFKLQIFQFYNCFKSSSPKNPFNFSHSACLVWIRIPKMEILLSAPFRRFGLILYLLVSKTILRNKKCQ